MADNISGASGSTGSLNGDFSAASGIFGSIASGLNSYNQSSLKQATDMYASQIAGINSQIATWQAGSAIMRGQQEEGAAQLSNAATYSQQRASMAANGVDLTSGSAVDVLASTKYVGNVNDAIIADNAARAAWGYQVAATSATNEQQFYSAAADQVDPLAAGAGSFLSTAGSVADKWTQTYGGKS